MTLHGYFAVHSVHRVYPYLFTIFCKQYAHTCKLLHAHGDRVQVRSRHT